MPYPLENALFQWEEGWRRFGELSEDRGAARRADRALRAVGDELRRRIGPTFRAAELAELYGEGTDWAQDVAMQASGGADIDPATITDAAFWLYMRGAADYAGGRQLALD